MSLVYGSPCNLAYGPAVEYEEAKFSDSQSSAAGHKVYGVLLGYTRCYGLPAAPPQTNIYSFA